VVEVVRYGSIAVGAMLGANVRYVITNWAVDQWGPDFPFGTLLINVTGAFTIGLFLAYIAGRADVNPRWRLFFATGFLGGYTTFSSYAWDALTLSTVGAWLGAGVYVVGSNVAGLFGVWLGARLAHVLE
jgi:fluoride exporter